LERTRSHRGGRGWAGARPAAADLRRQNFSRRLPRKIEPNIAIARKHGSGCALDLRCKRSIGPAARGRQPAALLNLMPIAASAMSKHLPGTIGRRDMLRALTAGAIAATAVSAPLSPAQAEAENTVNKGRARYQANSAEVQTFYRVNRYPTQCGRHPC
jgi:hypothetical protein